MHYGKNLDGAISLGLHANYGYLKSISVRNLFGGLFVQFKPESWVFFGRFYADFMMLTDTSGNSRSNPPYNGGNASGATVGISAGVHWPQAERFKLAPELSVRTGRITKDPTMYALANQLGRRPVILKIGKTR